MPDPFAPSLSLGPERAVVVLTISSIDEDHEVLGRILGRSNWVIHEARGCREAQSLLRRERVAVVVCERQMADGCWRDVLDQLPADNPPLLIVASRHADDSLWAEVLNLGGYDVLPKPFEPPEVIRIVSLAWLHWRQQAKSGVSIRHQVLQATA